MNIIDNGIIRKLQADEDCKITDSRYSFFSDFIILGKNDDPNKYLEVPNTVWGSFLENEIPKNKVEELTAKIKTLEDEKAELEDKLHSIEREHGDYLLDNDLRITMLELGLA